MARATGPRTFPRHRPPQASAACSLTHSPGSGSRGETSPVLTELRPTGFLWSRARRALGCGGAAAQPFFSSTDHLEAFPHLFLHARGIRPRRRSRRAGGSSFAAGAIGRRSLRQERRPPPGSAPHDSSPPPQNPSAAFPRSAATACAASTGTTFRTPQISIPLGKTAPDLACGHPELPRGAKSPPQAPGAAHARPRSSARAPRAPLCRPPAASGSGLRARGPRFGARSSGSVGHRSRGAALPLCSPPQGP